MINWWLEIRTVIPPCVHYFGPFLTKEDARVSEYGYVEDLLKEKAHGITVEIKQFDNPKELAVFKN